MAIKQFKRSGIICLIALVVGLFFLNTTVSPQKITVLTEEKQEAEKAWEALIKTKGGREKLHSINNLLMEMAVGTPTYDFVTLSVFPDYEWEFAYSLKFTPSGSVWNQNELTVYGLTEKGINSVKKYDGPKAESAIDTYALERITYLLETKWDQPELLRIRRTKLGKKEVDLLEAQVGKKRVDFLFEPEEMLVLEVHFYNTKGKVFKKYMFSNYASVDGIMMPQTRGGWYISDKTSVYFPIRFSFNVEFDKKIFEFPMRVESPSDWKPKKEASSP